MVLGACAAAAVLAVGITFFNSYQNMQGTVSALIPGIGAKAEEEVQSASSENVRIVLGKTGNGEETEQTVSDEQMVSENQAVPGSQSQPDDQSTLDSQIQSEAEAQLQEESRTQSETPVSSESQEESDSQKEEEQADSDAAASQTSGNSMQEYIIRKGDTLSSICKRKYGTIARMNEICQLNEMSADDIIYAGEKILLPD